MPSYTTLPARLDYRVSNPPEDLIFEHSLDGTAVAPRMEPCPIPVGFSLPSPPPARLARTALELGPGRVELRDDFNVEPSQTLTIHPGTQILLAPGKGLFCQGKLLAEGTSEKPITVRPLDPAKPFGCVGIWGPGSKGSRLTWFDIAGGSVAARQGVGFKGMFNVYQCPELELEDFRVGKNYVGDDAMNLANSQVKLTRLSFENALFDSLDLDACNGTLSDSSFLSGGNDGVDLSTCRMEISNCRFIRCGDKGVSVGEGSRANLKDCLIRECVTGVAVKDRSSALVEGCRLEASKTTALAAYRKKWIFVDGGTLTLKDSVVEPWSAGMVDIDEFSRLYWPEYPETDPNPRTRKLFFSGMAP